MLVHLGSEVGVGRTDQGQHILTEEEDDLPSHRWEQLPLLDGLWEGRGCEVPGARRYGLVVSALCVCAQRSLPYRLVPHLLFLLLERHRGYAPWFCTGEIEDMEGLSDLSKLHI